MRGTFKGIEVKRRGGEHAHRRVGSLKFLQGLIFRQKTLRPASASFFFNILYFSRTLPTDEFPAYGALFLRDTDCRVLCRKCREAEGELRRTEGKNQ